MQLSISLTVRTIMLLDEATIENNLYFLCDIVNDKNSLKNEGKIRHLKMHFTPSH